MKWVETFPWESEDQRKGFLAFVQWVQKRGNNDIPMSLLLACWQAQKGHESTEWIMSTVGEHVSRLENEIMELRSRINELKNDVL